MKKNKSKLPLIIIISVICVSFAGVGICALLKHSEKSNDNEDYLQNIEYPDVRAYFEERSDIVSITPVKDSSNTLSEKGAFEELEERGFIEYPITADYTFEGGAGNSVDISYDSDALHPLYRTYYITSDDVYWAITMVDGKIMATPSSYNWGHTGGVPIELSETEEIASYDLSTNSIYLTIPFDSTLDVRIVDRIDAETLESFDLED